MAKWCSFIDSNPNFHFQGHPKCLKDCRNFGPMSFKRPMLRSNLSILFSNPKGSHSIRITVCCAFASNSWIPALMSLPMPSSVARIPKVKSAYWNPALMAWWKESPTVTRIRSIHISHGLGCIVDCMMELSLTRCTCNRTKYNDQHWDNK